MSFEFDAIAKYFKPLAGPEGLMLMDDAAQIAPLPGQDMIITKDMIIESIHFRSNDKAYDIAVKALAVNLSDLSAKGAKPFLYFLGLGLPKKMPQAEKQQWLTDFSKGLSDVQSSYGFHIGGGDTVSTPNDITISVTILGYAPKGAMITRSGAVDGDDIWVTGHLGDAAFGLDILLNRHDQSNMHQFDEMVNAYLRPVPRVVIGQGLRSIASACADISDGLLSDIRHIASASNLAAVIYEERLPISIGGQAYIEQYPQEQEKVFNGGDDYELLFTASPDKQKQIQSLMHKYAIPITKIGTMQALNKASHVKLLDKNGIEIEITKHGYSHL